MARKTEIITITREGSRDLGKRFLITEMPATKGERWATRALIELAKSGISLPNKDELETLGMAGIATLGFRALSNLSWQVAEPLLEEMFECIQILRDPKLPKMGFALIEEDIEEIDTRLLLRAKVFSLHTDFLRAAVRSIWASAAASQTDDSPTP